MKLFSKNKIQEIGKAEKSIIVNQEVVLFRNENVEDLTQKLLENIHQDKEYKTWLKSLTTSEGLVFEIENLVVETKNIIDYWRFLTVNG